MKITTIGIDLAKTVLQVHGIDKYGNVGLRKQLKRKDVLSFFANLEPCLIGMEACGSAHYWARKLSELGHTVRLMGVGSYPLNAIPQILRGRRRMELRQRDRRAIDAASATAMQ